MPRKRDDVLELAQAAGLLIGLAKGLAGTPEAATLRAAADILLVIIGHPGSTAEAAPATRD